MNREQLKEAAAAEQDRARLERVYDVVLKFSDREVKVYVETDVLDSLGYKKETALFYATRTELVVWLAELKHRREAHLRALGVE